MRRRGKTTTFGQRGGDGPNTGKKAAFFECDFNGRTLKKRDFNAHHIPMDATVAVAVLVGAAYDAHKTARHKPTPDQIWTVAATEEELPSYVKHGLANPVVPGAVVIVSGKRVK